jgi:hypothetical protein
VIKTISKTKVTVVLAMLAIFAAFAVIAGCTNISPGTTSNREITTPLEFGNGVLYFQSVHTGFGDSLSSYIKDHPDMRVVSIASDTFSNGYIVGYFVVVEKRS